MLSRGGELADGPPNAAPGEALFGRLLKATRPGTGCARHTQATWPRAHLISQHHCASASLCEEWKSEFLLTRSLWILIHTRFPNIPSTDQLLHTDQLSSSSQEFPGGLMPGNTRLSALSVTTGSLKPLSHRVTKHTGLTCKIKC